MAGLACVELFFIQMQNELRLFIEFCVTEGVSIGNIPTPEEVTLSKLANVSIAMSDNAHRESMHTESQTTKQLTEALGQLDSDTKTINFLKTQIIIYTEVAGWKEDKGKDKFSKKGNPFFWWVD